MTRSVSCNQCSLSPICLPLAVAPDQLEELDRIMQRGLVLGRERKDAYVGQLNAFFPKGGDRELRLIHRLLICALIEARSCERFRVLSENLEDKELSEFYHTLMISEANHYTMFLKLART